MYDTDMYDMFSPMFDEDLHPKDGNIDVFDKPEFRRKCVYCNTEFTSRNQLFKHLAYMGLAIKRNAQKKKKTRASLAVKKIINKRKQLSEDNIINRLNKIKIK